MALDLTSSSKAPDEMGLSGLVHALDWVAAGIELVAVILMLVGTLRFVAKVVPGEVGRDRARRVGAMNAARIELGGYILSALELLIVSDLIHTALSLALQDLLFLALLVAIRSAISFFLDREIGKLKEEQAP
ncbi:MAG: hypothetical protein CML68_16635 [Rhodobacteraceae bacterium]|nr:hypothetical protein [Paracoccaceae bacterium]